MLTSTLDIVNWKKEYYKYLLNPTDMPSTETAEYRDSEEGSPITMAEVIKVF